MCKQPLMMAYDGFKSARDNFGKFIQQLQSETKALIRKLERILIKLYRQNVSVLFNETYIRGLSISFQAFFVQAFKIIVDSWKFSILLLYIL